MTHRSKYGPEAYRWLPRGRISWFALLVFSIGGCGEPPADDSCDKPSCRRGMPAEDAAIGNVVGSVDAALAPVEAAPLAVSIAVSGTARSCGGCAVVTAHPSGGRPPYTYVWSDEELPSHAGPHEVCGETARELTVSVRDTAPVSLDGTPTSSGEVESRVSLPCTQNQGDAGNHFSGCKLLLNASIITLLDPKGARVENIYSCSALDGSGGLPTVSDAGSAVPPVAQYIALPEQMLAGHSYELSVELLLSFQLGGDQRLEFWGTRAGCSTEEKLGEISISGQQQGATVCLSPQANYDKLLTRASESSVNPDFAISLGVSMTLCSDCTKP